MTEHTDSVLDNGNDLELITRMLNGQLDPVRVAAVRKRLEEDAAFRDLAAPLLIMWSLPKHYERFPRPEGEADRDWERLQQRIRIDTPAAAPAPAPDRVLWSSRRTWERILWFVVAFMVIVPLGATLWFDVLKPTYFPDPTDGWVAPSRVVAPSTSPR